MQCPPVRIDYLGIPNIRAGAADELLGGGLATGYIGPGSELYLNGFAALSTTQLNVINQNILLVVERYIAAIARGDAALATDLAVEIAGINQDFGSGPGTFANTEHSLQTQAASGSLLDEVIDNDITLKQLLQLLGALIVGKTSGAGGGVEAFKALNGEQVRVSMAYDARGNRTSVTLTFS